MKVSMSFAKNAGSKPAFETGISKRKREKTGRRKEPALRSDAKADGRTISADCRICGSAGTVYGSQGIHRLLGKILIVGSYLKRRKNLTLSALEGKKLKEEELIQSLRESCSNLVFCEIQGQYYIETGKETLPAQLVLRAYDFFEQIVELLLKQGGSFFYRLTELNGVLRISVNLEGDCQTESLQEKYPLVTYGTGRRKRMVSGFATVRERRRR